MTTKAITVTKLSTSKKMAKSADESSIEKAVIQNGTKPSDLFRGVWSKNNERLCADEIRKQAWQRKK